jgi:hypothetical protein
MGAPVNQTVTCTTNNILQGAGKIEIDGIQIGSFQGGLAVNKTQSEKWVESDYGLGTIDGEIDKVSVELATELEEATLENLAMAWGHNSSSAVSATSSKVFDFNPAKTMIEHSITFRGQSATNKLLDRVFTATRCVAIGASSVKLQRGVKTVVPVTLRLLQASSGSYFTVVDNTVS